ncbi:uncharacterized protein LOC114969907 [Acropora millepora]|uniref:uncharacterized protein LOC114969907 n=1 Tax=Acropora millepora TaxID=45264 RepID=UPI001CF41DD3|nr:uncharacterized protein LOC114969907 [Acropora millepora]
MGHSTGQHVVLLGAMFLLTGIDGSNITWLEPPPLKTVKDASRISRTNKQVIQGSHNEELSCNFSLTPDLTLRSVWMEVRNVSTVTFVPNVSLSVPKGIAKSLNATWVPNKLTLIFFKVTAAEKGEYTCNVVTIGRSPRTWIRKIQLLVVGKLSQLARRNIEFKKSYLLFQLQKWLMQTKCPTVRIFYMSATLSSFRNSQRQMNILIYPRQTMVSASITVPQNPILTTDYSTRASEGKLHLSSGNMCPLKSQ